MFVCARVRAPEHMCYSSGVFCNENLAACFQFKDALSVIQAFASVCVFVCPTRACTHSSVPAKVIMSKFVCVRVRAVG